MSYPNFLNFANIIVVSLIPSVVRHVRGSSEHPIPHAKDKYSRITALMEIPEPIICAADGCEREVQNCAHVMIPSLPKEQFIVKLCRDHNPSWSAEEFLIKRDTPLFNVILFNRGLQ